MSALCAYQYHGSARPCCARTHEIERLLEAAADAGATRAGYITLRLPLEVGPLFQEWLERYCPDRARRVMGRVRELHGGRDYDATFGKRMKGEGVHARLIARRFEAGCRRYGLTTAGRGLRCDLFRLPPRIAILVSPICHVKMGGPDRAHKVAFSSPIWAIERRFSTCLGGIAFIGASCPQPSYRTLN